MTTIPKNKAIHPSSFTNDEEPQKTDSSKTLYALDDLSCLTVNNKDKKKPLLSSTSLWALDLASDRFYELVGSELLPSALLQWKNVTKDVANRGELLPSARVQWKKVTGDVVAKRGELLPSARVQWKKVTGDLVAKRCEANAVVKMMGPDRKWNSTSDSFDRPTDEGNAAEGMEGNAAEGMEGNAAEGMEGNAAEGVE